MNHAGETGRFDVDQLSKGQKQEYAYHFIKERIKSHTYKPLQQLKENQLSEDLGCMSRTPIRDAVKRLAAEGYIDLRSNGMVVTKISIEDVMEISEIRMWLESGTVKLFVERAQPSEIARVEELFEAHALAHREGRFEDANRLDNEYHLAIADGSKNKRARTMLAQLIDEYSRGAYALPPDEKHEQQVLAQHWAILEAVKNKEIALAENTMKEHLTTCVTHLKELKLNNYYLFTN
ncbi:MAG: GntR family transcriptional regulator [Christensenellales bacterium]